MWRYLAAALIIGILVFSGVFFLQHQGIFDALATRIFAFYESIRLYRGGTAPASSLNPILQTLVLVIASFGMAWVAVDVARFTMKAVILIGTLLVIAGLSATLGLYGIAFEPVSGMTAALAAFIGGTFYARTDHGQRKRSLATILGSRVSSQTFHQVLNSAQQLDLEGEKRELSVLSVQFFNQPALVEKLDPIEVVEITNLFLKNSVDHLMTLGGYLDDSSPDQARFFFVLNENGDRHAVAACLAALDLRQRLDNLSKECDSRWHQPLEYGIGICTGTITLGMFGSAHHVYFSGLGPDIESARRLGQRNERFGSRVLIAARTYALSKDAVEVRPMDLIHLPKQGVQAEVYELLSEQDGLEDETHASRDSFWQGMIYFRKRNYDSALEMFSRARVPDEHDAPLEYYIARTQEYLVHPERAAAARQ